MRSSLLFYLGTLIVLIVVTPPVNAQDCYESSIVSPTPFMGNNGEIFKIADGSLWEVKYEYEYLYEYYSSVIICPSRGVLIIGEKSLNVELVAAAPGSNKAGSKQIKDWEIFEITNLEGSISGTVQQGHIFKTTSGYVYEVTGLTLQLLLELQPAVTVLRNGDIYKLIIEGFDEPLICKCHNCASTKRNTAPKNEITTQGHAVIESTIISDFDGLNYGNIYKLANGQIWEQTEVWLWVWIWVNPSVVIWNDGGVFKIKVDQIDHAVLVRRIK
jgi:hypothetical protein